MIGHERANVRADDLPREHILLVGNGKVIGNTARQNGYEQKRRKATCPAMAEPGAQEPHRTGPGRGRRGAGSGRQCRCNPIGELLRRPVIGGVPAHREAELLIGEVFFLAKGAGFQMPADGGFCRLIDLAVEIGV